MNDNQSAAPHMELIKNMTQDLTRTYLAPLGFQPEEVAAISQSVVAACIHHSEIALDEVGHVVKLGGDSSAAAAIVGLGQIAAALLNLGARSHFQGETQEQRDAFAASLARVYAMPTAAPQVFSRNPAAVS